MQPLLPLLITLALAVQEPNSLNPRGVIAPLHASLIVPTFPIPSVRPAIIMIPVDPPCQHLLIAAPFFSRVLDCHGIVGHQPIAHSLLCGMSRMDSRILAVGTWRA